MTHPFARPASHARPFVQKRCALARGAALLFALLLAAAPLHAQTCSVAMQDVLFGVVDTTTGRPTDVDGSMTINCTGYATPYVRVCINLGWPDGGIDNRGMTGPASARLRYEIYSDATRTRAWYVSYEAQARVVFTDIALNAGAGSATVPYYARVFSGQSTVPTGNYVTFYDSGAENIKVYAYSGTPPTCGSISNTATYPFYVRATVSASCSVSATDVNFGQIGFMSGPVDTTGLISTTCTATLPYTLSLNAGVGSGATVTSRRLTRASGGNTLNYSLYSDAARTQQWGDGTAGSQTVAGTGTGNTQTATIYARLPAQAAAAPGTYTDTIVVTVTF